MYNKHGPTDLDDFSALEQSKLVADNSEIVEFVAPSNAQVFPMTNLLFKIC